MQINSKLYYQAATTATKQAGTLSQWLVQTPQLKTLCSVHSMGTMTVSLNSANLFLLGTGENSNSECKDTNRQLKIPWCRTTSGPVAVQHLSKPHQPWHSTLCPKLLCRREEAAGTGLPHQEFCQPTRSCAQSMWGQATSPGGRSNN